MKELLRELVSLPGTCGFEENVAQYLYRRVAPLADEAYVDGLGNLIVMKQGGQEGPTLMLSAHMDEVGFMVRKIVSGVITAAVRGRCTTMIRFKRLT